MAQVNCLVNSAMGNLSTSLVHRILLMIHTCLFQWLRKQIKAVKFTNHRVSESDEERDDMPKKRGYCHEFFNTVIS